ncbi:Na+/H+ antiporter [Entomomonas moraniae]|uniref:Na+/H+ antiporter n=1 Tax=Entomomonas moraniae TaxID=2213226 RepID=A0A451EQ07_9GAMM|nr:Na+/H+ antiporter [Entomomonas moraniae]AZS51906.1 Na+/H+ antiporter [Entomomonas moraniae]
MQSAYTVLSLLILVGISQLSCRLVPFIPVPILQICLGTIVAWPAFGLHVEFEPELFLMLFLPPLLFSDGWHVPKRDLWKYRWPILLLAVGLVVFTVVAAGYFIHFLIPAIPLPAAFALAAMLSPTDAVAVSAVTRGKLPTPLMRLLQGESLMNDASGLVTFQFAIAAAITGVFSLLDASVAFLIVALGGLAIGVIMSWLLGLLRSWMINRGWDDPATHVMFMLLLPFVAYVVAEHLHVSGILSAVAAGMMQSWVDLLPKQTSTRLLNRSVWGLLEFVFNGLIFVLLGLQLPSIIKKVLARTAPEQQLSTFLSELFVIFLIFFILVLLRYLWIQSNWFVMSRFRRLRKNVVDVPKTKHAALLLTFGGVRGAVTLAGTLSIPLFINAKLEIPFPERDTMIFIAVGVILLSLVTACILLPILLSNVEAEVDVSRKKELQDARRKTAEAAIHALEIEDLTNDPKISQDPALATMVAEVKARIMAEYREHLNAYDNTEEIQARVEENDKIEKTLRLRALRAQRLELYSLRRHRAIGDDTVKKVLDELDIQEASLGGVASSH